MQRTATLVLGLALVSTAAARPTYPARLPNGANVPGVAALGHVDVDGGGANNDFGLDFASAGHEWTAAFCAQDSDGDGQTNGQELGDPCCEWAQDANAVVRWTEGVSHPGDASDTSDPALWANVTCGDGSASVAGSAAAAAASSSAASPTAGSNATAASATAAGATAAPAASSPSAPSPATLTPTLTPTHSSAKPAAACRAATATPAAASA